MHSMGWTIQKTLQECKRMKDGHAARLMFWMSMASASRMLCQQAPLVQAELQPLCGPLRLVTRQQQQPAMVAILVDALHCMVMPFILNAHGICHEHPAPRGLLKGIPHELHLADRGLPV